MEASYPLCHKEPARSLRVEFTNIFQPAVAGQLPGRSQSEVIPGPLEGADLVVDDTVQPHLLALPHGDVLGLVQELLLASGYDQQDGGEHEELHCQLHRE